MSFGSCVSNVTLDKYAQEEEAMAMSNTASIIAPIVTKTYGDTDMATALVENLAEKIDDWPRRRKHHSFRDREDMVRMTCWDWFSGGSTAECVAEDIEAALQKAQAQEPQS
jgi:hypothetical protein